MRRRVTVWEGADERWGGGVSWWSIWPWKINTIVKKMELLAKEKVIQGKSVSAPRERRHDCFHFHTDHQG